MADHSVNSRDGNGRFEVDCLDLFGRIRQVPREEVILRLAAYAIMVRDGRILLVQMKSTGKYHLPGGGIEAGEHIEECLQRELFEETDLEIQVGPLAFFDEIFFYFNPSGRAYHGLHFIFFCQLKSAPPAGDWEALGDSAEKPAWVPLAGLRGEDFQASGEKILEFCSH
jgi:8-oxo-dGTP pyrophosphatase MutT (NUDIX family)